MILLKVTVDKFEPEAAVDERMLILVRAQYTAAVEWLGSAVSASTQDHHRRHRRRAEPSRQLTARTAQRCM